MLINLRLAEIKAPRCVDTTATFREMTRAKKQDKTKCLNINTPSLQTNIWWNYNLSTFPNFWRSLFNPATGVGVCFTFQRVSSPRVVLVRSGSHHSR